jgi:N-acetyl sugar amidotransferase
MKYCKKCVLPDTRPNLILDKNQICNACNCHETKETINWDCRENKFKEVVKYAQENSKGYDCIIPVSGGKDSTWQTVKCLEYGLNPLAVTWKTPARTDIGQRNLENLIKLGVDHIDYSINPEVEKKFMVKALKKYASTAIPMHMAMFNITLKIAVKFDVPLIVWGENSALEYGGASEFEKEFKLDNNWLKKYGVMNGTTAEDWIDDELTKKEMTPYFSPSQYILEKKDIRAVFLGYYFKWDIGKTYKVAKKHGFKPRPEGPKTGLYEFADIDDDFISIHHFLKWYKFGFSRLFDNLSLEIRNKRLTRVQALDIIRRIGPQVPYEDIKTFCKFTGLKQKSFFQIIEKFRNPKIWTFENRLWKINGFIIPEWGHWEELSALARINNDVWL